MKVRDILSGPLAGYTRGQTLTDALGTTRLDLGDEYDACTNSSCSHQTTCYHERQPTRRGRRPRTIAVATQVGLDIISFGVKDCMS